MGFLPRLMVLLACILSLGAAQRTAEAQTNLFRIGTGGVAGTYYPIGGLIADIISSPPGARPCERGGSCGVPGLIAIVQSSDGSVANIEAISDGSLESGFVQSDIAYGAYTGSGVFSGREPFDELRVVASLYVESVHLVARREAGIETVADLEGRPVSLDDMRSGTLGDARLLLGAYGLSEEDIEPYYLKPSRAVPMMREGKLDAFFITAGYPTASVSELTEDGTATLVPMTGQEIDQLLIDQPFFSYDRIPEGVYPGVPETPTIGVVAQWLVSSRLDEELVYGITKALWRDSARALLDQGHAKGREITLDTALNGLAIPLHPGAERFYREQGLLD